MEVIDLVGQIALKNIPKRIKYNDYEWEYDGENYKIQASSGTYMNWDYIIFNCLNEEVEIIDNEERKSITKEDIEAIGYACGEIKKSFENGWKKSLENKPLVEDNKIEKLKLKDNWCRKKGDYIITDYEINPLILNKINEIIDYIEPKYTGSTYTIKRDED